MQHTDKARAEFEAWASERFEAPADALMTWRTDESPEHGYPYRSGNDEVDLAIGSAWIGWQASRASVVVELPQPFEGDDFSMYDGAELKAAIEAAGLTVKE